MQNQKHYSRRIKTIVKGFIDFCKSLDGFG